ncbi:dehydrodolichyl diphosphate synthase complex subunit Nus1-like isoform X2 [Asparagus officinalis]|nr:dehydrodolichyl diphosphate synthase complex subunit Nus1-like isoform X2 [Asparagus officinalis]
MIFNKEMERMMTHLRRLHISRIFIYILRLSWYLLHLLVSIMHTGSYLIQVMKWYIISTGFLQKYRMLPLHKLQYLAVVIDSAEAENATQIKQLLHWLLDIGVKYIMLYDMEGVLKQYLETYLISLANSSLANSSCNAKPCTDTSLKNAITRVRFEKTTIELLSSSDCKQGAAKAANFLLSNYLKGDTEGCNKTEPTFTEADISAALKSVGFDGPEPDLLLVYGPARCHLGFPAWRMRYTEIVHMGHLKSMKRGAIIKAIYDFTNKHQNYGT